MLYLGRTLEDSCFGFREDFADSTNASLPPQRRSRRSSSIGSAGSSSSGGSSGSVNRIRTLRGPSPFARLHPLPPFHDASPIVCTYDLTVYDCLLGLDKARRLGFFRFGNAPPAPAPEGEGALTGPPLDPPAFDADEYAHFEQVENGDLNWIVHGKVLAFAGPQAERAVTPEGFCMLTPGDYVPYFLKSNVRLVVRLNRKCYDEREFEKVGIGHVEHYYLDGSCPPLDILHAVIPDMEGV